MSLIRQVHTLQFILVSTDLAVTRINDFTKCVSPAHSSFKDSKKKKKE